MFSKVGLHIWFLAAFASCVACHSMVGPVYLTGEQVDRTEYGSSYRVTVLCDDGMAAGSAVAVDGRHLLTARHVVTCSDETSPLAIAVISWDGVRWPVLIDALDNHDAARLVVEGTSDNAFPVTAKVSPRIPRIGERICIIGGDRPSVYGMRKCGDVSPGSNEWEFIVSLHVVPGNSGGPAFDSQGNVIGIVSKGAWGEGHEFFVILTSVNSIQALANTSATVDLTDYLSH